MSYDSSIDQTNPLFIRQILCAGDVRHFEYLLHPVPGNLVLLMLRGSPESFWKIFSSLPVAVYENYGPRLFQILDRANFPVAYLLELCRHCSAASIPILYWIVSRIAYCSAKKDIAALGSFLRSKNVNLSAVEMFESAAKSPRKPLHLSY
jgi:hypothetical protein